MSVMTRSIVSLVSLSLALAACGENEKKSDDLARLDAELTTNTADPALAEALEGPLASDPDLTGAANHNAVRPADKPLNGAVPAKLSPKKARAKALLLAGGKLMETPAATKSVVSTKEPVTLGGMAEKKQSSDTCGTPQISYNMQWANKMPAALPVYPGANVTEAAGTNKTGACGMRAVSFTTAVPANEVMDFYYTMAQRAGYSTEHNEQNGGNILGGTREKDDTAYYASFKPLQGGGTTVELIATGGR